MTEGNHVVLVSFLPYSLKWSSGFSGFNLIPWWKINELTVDGAMDFQKRVTATRILAVGIFALAVPKASQAAVSFLTVSDVEDNTLVFQMPHPPAEVEGQLANVVNPAWRALWNQSAGTAPATQQPDVLDQLRKLGELRDAGVLTTEEFESKKTELLGRL